jgi:flagellin
MPIRVNNNIAAMNTRHTMNRSATTVQRQLERLSSGLRITKAADDASGLTISEGMRGEVAGLKQNVRNAEQAASMLQVAEGSLQEVNKVLVRLRELAVQSASSTVSDTNRESVAAEFGQLVAEIDRIAQATTYNHKALLTGFGNQVSAAGSTALSAESITGVQAVSLAAAEASTYTFVDSAGDGLLTLGNGATTQTLDMGTALDGSVVQSGTSVVANFDRLGIQVTLAGSGLGGATGDYADGDLNGETVVVEPGTGGVFQVGPSESYVNRIEVGISDLRAGGAALNIGDLSVSSLSGARQALSGLDAAVATVAHERGRLGAVQNRLFFTVAYSENSIESIQASEASIRDADVAREVTDFSRASIMLQSSSAMLAQANITSQQVLSLL